MNTSTLAPAGAMEGFGTVYALVFGAPVLLGSAIGAVAGGREAGVMGGVLGVLGGGIVASAIVAGTAMAAQHVGTPEPPVMIPVPNGPPMAAPPTVPYETLRSRQHMALAGGAGLFVLLSTGVLWASG